MEFIHLGRVVGALSEPRHQHQHSADMLIKHIIINWGVVKVLVRETECGELEVLIEMVMFSFDDT